MGLDALKAGFGWSDEELHDNFIFDMQVRYALGYQQLGEGEFELRTIYNFRQRLVEHLNETGENLIEKAFEQITDEQVKAYQLKTGRLRMDSTQIASEKASLTNPRTRLITADSITRAMMTMSSQATAQATPVIRSHACGPTTGRCSVARCLTATLRIRDTAAPAPWCRQSR